jgi:hypothetical protein
MYSPVMLNLFLLTGYMLLPLSTPVTAGNYLSFENDGAYVAPNSGGKPCNCKDGDPTSWTFAYLNVTKVTFSGQCDSDGWCGISYTMSGPNASGSVAIPRGKCVDKVNIWWANVPGPERCTPGGSCRSGEYPVGSPTFTPVYSDCVKPGEPDPVDPDPGLRA